MRFIFEVELKPEESGTYCVSVPDLPGCITEGDTVSEACEMAADALMTFVSSMIKHSEDIPAPVFGHAAPDGGKVIAISFETDAEYVSDVVSPAEAAQMLGVTRGRVSQMIHDGVLDAYKIDKDTKVKMSSINARLATPRRPGRPKKELATA
jgi:excisionase family DNA binding protein